MCIFIPFAAQVCSQIPMHMLPYCYTFEPECFSLACIDRLSFSVRHCVCCSFLRIGYQTGTFIGYRTGTLDCQNKGTYLEDACCSYSEYCDFYVSLDHEYHTAVQYLEFEQKLQITAKTKKFQMWSFYNQCFLIKLNCLYSLTFFDKLCMHTHVQTSLWVRNFFMQTDTVA